MSACYVFVCSVVLVWPEEWHKLLQWYTSHTAICIHLTKSDGSTPIVQTSPGMVVYICACISFLHVCGAFKVLNVNWLCSIAVSHY